MKFEKEEYFDMWKRRLEEKESCIEQMRAIKHDMQAHMIVLQYYLESDMYDDAKMYLRVIRDVQTSMDKKIEIDTGNGLVNALIEDYLSRDKDISFWCDGKFSDDIKMSNYELCVLFSNLMSNAVEACGKLSDLPKEINMKLAVVKNQFEIRVENYVEWDIDVQLLGKGTTKEDSDNHGYGIKNMKRVVEDNNGNIFFDVVEKKFCIHIKIPLIEFVNE